MLLYSAVQCSVCLFVCMQCCVRVCSACVYVCVRAFECVCDVCARARACVLLYSVVQSSGVCLYAVLCACACACVELFVLIYI